MIEASTPHSVWENGRRVLHLSYEKFNQLKDGPNIIASQSEFNFNGKKLFSTRNVVPLEGMLIVNDGMVWSTLDRSLIQAYSLKPVEAYSGPTYMVPAHQQMGLLESSVTLPDGNVRHRGNNTGLLCLVDGKKMVFAEALTLKAKLPTSVLDVKRKDIDNVTSPRLINQNYSWGDATREWIDYKGVPVQVLTSDDDSSFFFVYGRDRRGIFDIMLERLDLVDELLASKPAKREFDLEMAEQLSFF